MVPARAWLSNLTHSYWLKPHLIPKSSIPDHVVSSNTVSCTSRWSKSSEFYYIKSRFYYIIWKCWLIHRKNISSAIGSALVVSSNSIVLPFSVSAMTWKGVHHAFITESAIHNNKSVNAMQRAFQNHLYLVKVMPFEIKKPFCYGLQISGAFFVCEDHGAFRHKNMSMLWLNSLFSHSDDQPINMPLLHSWRNYPEISACWS